MEAVGQTQLRTRAISGADVVWLATGTLLLLGFAFRARGFLFGTIPFWEDEAAWAIRTVDLPLGELAIRPLGFMAISKLLAHLLSPSETVLRALPWLAGVASLSMSPLLARRLFSSAAARLLFVAVVALHPGAIDLAKEFKPYSVSLALHMAFLLLGLSYLEKGTLRWLLPLLGLLLLGTFFAQDALFAYPGLFALLLFEAFRVRRRRHLLLIASTAVATLAVVAGMYVGLWSKAVGDDTTEYWGKKYDVFYVPSAEPTQSRLAWSATRVGDIAAMPGMRRSNWTPGHLAKRTLGELQQLDVDVWRALGLVGLGALVLRGKRREALLLLGPMVVLFGFNAFGFWPLGAFRTNLFTLVYAAGIVAAGVDRTISELDGWDLMPAGVLVVIPFLLLGRTTHSTKASSMVDGSAFPEALRTLTTLQERAGGARAQLVLDNPSCSMWRYYLRYHPDKAHFAEQGSRFNARCTKNLTEMVQVLRKGLKTPESRTYALVSRSRSMEDVETNLPADLAIDGHTYLGEHDHLVVSVKKAP